MLARCARVEPACIRARSGLEYLISSFFSTAVTVTPSFKGSVSEPLAPLMVTEPGATVAVTPCGSSTGAFATLDIRFAYLFSGIAADRDPLQLAARFRAPKRFRIRPQCIKL